MAALVRHSDVDYRLQVRFVVLVAAVCVVARVNPSRKRDTRQSRRKSWRIFRFIWATGSQHQRLNGIELTVFVIALIHPLFHDAFTIFEIAQRKMSETNR